MLSVPKRSGKQQLSLPVPLRRLGDAAAPSIAQRAYAICSVSAPKRTRRQQLSLLLPFAGILSFEVLTCQALCKELMFFLLSVPKRTGKQQLSPFAPFAG